MANNFKKRLLDKTITLKKIIEMQSIGNRFNRQKTGVIVTD
jgi:hypothetical protein